MTEAFQNSTGHSVFVELVDSTTGLPKTGVTAAQVTADYARSRSAAVSISVVALTNLTDGFTSGGWKEKGGGVYRFDVPDGAYAAGAAEVVATIAATGCRTASRGFRLIAWDKSLGNAGYPQVDLRQYGGGSVGTYADDLQNAAQKAGYAYDSAQSLAGDVAAVKSDTGTVLARVPSTVHTAAQQTADLSSMLTAVANVPGLVWAYSTRTLTSLAGVAADVWAALLSGLTTAGSVGKKLADWALGTDNRALLSGDAANDGLIRTALTNQGYTTARATLLGNLDAAVSSRLAAAGYTAPDNAGIAAIKGVADKLNTMVVSSGTNWAFTVLALSNAPAGGSSLTQQDVRDSMMLAPSAGAPAAGSVDAKLNSAASAGDPWSTSLPGSYAEGTAGYLVGHNTADDLAAALAGQIPVIINSPSTSQHINIFKGDAYDDADGTGRTLSFTFQTGEAWPDQIDSAAFYCEPTQATLDEDPNAVGLSNIACTVNTSTGSSRKVTLILTEAQTGSLTAGVNGYTFAIVANAAGNRAVLRSGTMTVRPDPTA